MERTFDRRQFLGLAGVSFLSACGSSEKSKTAEVENGKSRLAQEINALPDTHIKQLLQSRVLPIFSNQPPATLSRGGLDLQLHASSVNVTTEKPTGSRSAAPHGSYTIRQERTDIAPLKVSRMTVMNVPLPDLFTEQEKTLFGAQRTSSGTPYAIVNFREGGSVYEGIRPTIELTSPDASKITDPSLKQQVLDGAQFGYIKEACGALLNDIWVDESVTEMMNEMKNGRPGFDPRVPTYTKPNAEAFIQAYGSVDRIHQTTQNPNTYGRIVAGIDLAGYFAAFKALEGTALLDRLAVNDRSYAPAITSLKSVSAGTTAHDVLHNSVSWAITNPGASAQLFHAGDMNLLP